MTKSSTRPKFAPFLWPDHVIGKRESRRIREAQNALYNSHARLQTAIEALLIACTDKNNRGGVVRHSPHAIATAELALELSENSTHED